MKTPYNTQSPKKGGHGTMLSYVVGFILSLIFTANAYYAVVSKSITGQALLVAILGFALLQMAVQIFFFLHLGRGPKPLYNVVFFVGTVGIILVVVLGSMFIMDNLHYNMTPAGVTKKLAQEESISQVGGEKTGACKTVGINYKVTINNGVIIPNSIKARLCDTLTFISEDEGIHEIAFGPLPQNKDYAGQEVTARKGRSKTITLNQSGSFSFYDQLDPGITGQFIVNP